MFQTRFRRSASGGGFAFEGQPVWACQCPVTNRTQAVARSRTVHSVTAPGVRGRGGLAGSQAAARSSPVCGLISAGAGSLPSSLARLLAGGHAQGGCWPAAPQQRSWLRCSSRGQSASKREVTFSSDALEVTSCPPFHHLVLRSKSRAVPYSERWGHRNEELGTTGGPSYSATCSAAGHSVVGEVDGQWECGRLG